MIECPERPLEPPMEWDKRIYDFSDCDIPQRKGWGSCGVPWYDREEFDEYL